MRRDVFQAIADPTRRQIINLLAQQTLNLNRVAEHFEISRPAISKQIRILAECGLVKVEQQGRERYCQANLESLKQVVDWAQQYKTFWAGPIETSEGKLPKEPKSAKKKKKKKQAKKK